MRTLALTILMSMTTLIANGQSMKENFDFDWKFIEADVDARHPAFDDSKWATVDLPHDWDIHHAPTADAPMGNDGGYYPGGTGWYRKIFRSPALQAGDVCKLHFEGVYMQCEVYVNGALAGKHGYGYTPFRVDVTSLLKKGDNVVAVKVNNAAQPNCRWYSGSGIYRHVWMEVYKPGVMDDPERLFVTTDSIYGIAPDGTRADSAVVRISYEGMLDERRTLKDIKLWSPEHPALYDIQCGRLTVKHGIRSFRYNATEGLVLNNRPVIINGACMHHDCGVLGAMAFDEAEVRKVRLMKEAGFNLIRTSHNPQTRAMLDACDSLGMMVIDEAFDGWRAKKTAHDYHELMDSCCTEDLSAMVLRDRNHPSIICWSIGNEVIERKEIRVIQTAKRLKQIVLNLDHTRPVTEALCSWDADWEIFDPHAEVLDIVGYNYMMHKAQGDHQRCPERVMWQTESYPRDAFCNWQNTTSNPFIIGDIVWTGLDYLGESGIGQFYYEGEPRGEHYNGKHFPFHGAYCGDVDITGWQKPISHYRSMLYNVEEHDNNFIYMAVREPDRYHQGRISETQWSVWPTWQSWNWKGWEGKPIDVEIYTKADAVALYLNDTLVGKKQVGRDTEYKAVFTLPYEAGTLRATCLNAEGNEGACDTLSTTGTPYAVRLHAERTILNADGEDLGYVVMELVDREGRVVQDDDMTVDVEVKGAGRFLAAGSANLCDLEPMTSTRVTTYKGRALIVVRSNKKPGRISITAASSLKKATLEIQSKKH